MRNFTDSLTGNMVLITDDEMCAGMLICQKESGQKYSIDELMTLLAAAGVRSGVDTQAVSEIAESGIYNREITIAKGKKAVEGVDGEFTFHFKTELSAKPLECEDGTVDYSQIDFFVPVNKDQEIVTYTKAIPGSMGFTVTGRLLVQKRGKEKPALTGKGFRISEDNCHYYSMLDGQIKYEPETGHINISEILTIPGDLTIKEGNVNFRGDVCVKGAVRAGMKICATGNVIVDGIVEAADIKAGKSILLKSGAFGSGRGSIIAGNDIMGRFFEQCTVHAGNNISCSYIMGCNMCADGQIEVIGKKGLILSGETRAFLQVKSNNAGNEFGTNTKIAVGIDDIYIKRSEEIDNKLAKINSEIEIFKMGLQNESSMHDRIVLALSIKMDEKREQEEKKAELMLKMENASRANICITSKVYPGVQLIIDNDAMMLQTELSNVNFRRYENHIAIFRN